jgi:folate-binding protein YgfZ
MAGISGYQALREHAAWIDLSARGKIRMTGDDRARLLHAMSTQNIQAMHPAHVHDGIPQPGDVVYTFFLNAQGRILADANVLCQEELLVIDTEPELTVKLMEHLDKFIIADDVTLEDATAQLVTISIEGPESEAVLKRLGAPIPPRPMTFWNWDQRIVARMSSTGSQGFFVILPAEESKAFVDQLEIPQASAEEARIVRLEHGHPRYGDEITERFLAQETGQMHAVNFSKGCYLGQEIVERVRSRAQIHRVLRKLELATAEVPEPGTKLKAGDADAAEIVSAVYSPALQKTVALAYVRTTFADHGTEIAPSVVVI